MYGEIWKNESPNYGKRTAQKNGKRKTSRLLSICASAQKKKCGRLSEERPEEEGAVRIWKKIQILLLAAIFAAGCTVIVYESPERRARGVWEQHWHYCPYGSFWGHIYWQCMWYYRYPYYSRILSPGYSSRGGSVVTKKQLQSPTSSGGTTTSTKVTKRKVVKTEKEKPKKVIKKKKDV